MCEGGIVESYVPMVLSKVLIFPSFIVAVVFVLLLLMMGVRVRSESGVWKRVDVTVFAETFVVVVRGLTFGSTGKDDDDDDDDCGEWNGDCGSSTVDISVLFFGNGG